MKRKFSSMGRVAIALVLALSLFLMTAVPVSAAGALTVNTVVPGNPMAGATTTYPIEFITETAYIVDSVEMEFDAGFDVENAALSGTAAEIGEGTVSSLGQVVTYTVTEPEGISAATTITITLSGIVNPAAGNYSLTVRTKSGTATIDEGTSDDFTINPAPVSFKVEEPDDTVDSVEAGTAFRVKVTAMSEAEGAGDPVEGYDGDYLIDFSSTASDPKTIPAFAVINFDTGVGYSLVEFVLNVVEDEKTITVTDSEINVTGTSGAIAVNWAALGYLTITGAPASVTAGEAFVSDIIVTAVDAEGNAMVEDTTTITWSGGGESAALPSNDSLVDGTLTFDGADFTLEEAGSQTITVTGDGISGDAFITVNPAAATEFTLADDSDPIDADGVDASTITATAKDEFGNTDTNYTASVTFAASLGTLSDVSANFVAGVATATLTSTEVGMATILVTSGTLADVTETVVLDPALLAEVWVAIDGSDTNPGTEASPVKTISDAIAKVAAGGTIEVGPGTYTPSAKIEISLAGVTLKSTDGAADTIIDASGIADNSIILTGDNVTFEGFTIADSTYNAIAIWHGTEGVTVRTNIITEATASGITLAYNGAAPAGFKRVESATVSGNVITDCNTGIDFGGCTKDCMVSDNTITGCASDGRGIAFNGGNDGLETQGNTITGNTITDNACMGIYVKDDIPEDYFLDNLIDGNTISRNSLAGIEIEANLDYLMGLTITRNSITDNIGGGILMNDWDFAEDSVINFNNITGNTDYGIVLTLTGLGGTEIVDATQNWWGSVVAAEINCMIDEDDEDDVDYSSQLNGPHAIPAISLHTGWNLISLPLLPTDSTIETVLANVMADDTVLQVRTFIWEADLLDEKYWIPAPGFDLLDVVAGQGYWIEMSEENILSVTGVELALPGEIPPSYELFEGWNLIGFTSTSTAQASSYLGPAITNNLEAMYGYNAVTGLYQNIENETLLVPGNGYWIAVSEDWTIFP